MSLLATLLQTDRGLTAAEIQRQVEGYPEDKVAFRRSFERDKDDFRRLGVPIDVDSRQALDGPIDTYRVQRDDYYLHDLGLDPAELPQCIVGVAAFEPDQPQCHGQRHGLVGVESEVVQVVVVALHSIGVDRTVERLTAVDLDRYPEPAEVVLVAFERPAERHLVVGVPLDLPLDLGRGQPTIGLQQGGQQRHLPLELVDQGLRA